MKTTQNAEEVKSNRDLPAAVDPIAEENEKLRTDNTELRERIEVFSERIARLEAVQSTSKLRKYDELNDPGAQKHIGRVLSMDGKDPILWLEKTGNVVQSEVPGVAPVDEQTLSGETLSGKKVTFTFKSLVSLCSGNSIPCVVNNWKEYRAKEMELGEKRHLFQRSNGKSTRVDTVELREEIKQREKDLKLNVTLSLDLGKTFTGETCDIHAVSAFNALP